MMSRNMKPSVMWIAIGVLVLFFMVNHWMSCEITMPDPAEQPVVNTAPVKTEPVVVEQPKSVLPLPGVPIDGEKIQTPDQNAKKAVPPPQEDDGTHEPIYEPPSGNPVMAQ